MLDADLVIFFHLRVHLDRWIRRQGLRNERLVATSLFYKNARSHNMNRSMMRLFHSWSVRISTNRRILSRPLSLSKALEIVSGWLAQPTARTLSPQEEHWRILRSLLADTGTAGNLTTDAHLAALAIEHGCELCSTDNDFARFPKLRWTTPLS
jgi:toxin-antitoxin system PIN domain toxin